REIIWIGCLHSVLLFVILLFNNRRDQIVARDRHDLINPFVKRLSLRWISEEAKVALGFANVPRVDYHAFVPKIIKFETVHHRHEFVLVSFLLTDHHDQSEDRKVLILFLERMIASLIKIYDSGHPHIPFYL